MMENLRIPIDAAFRVERAKMARVGPDQNLHGCVVTGVVAEGTISIGDKIHIVNEAGKLIAEDHIASLEKNRSPIMQAKTGMDIGIGLRLTKHHDLVGLFITSAVEI